MKKIVILGGRESGVGAAVLATLKGIEVLVSDNGMIPKKYKNILEKHHIRYEEKKHSIDEILRADEIIKSPGISDNINIIQKIVQQNIPIISEIEFACRYTNAKIVAITGSNGKTTTTQLIYQILKNEGLNVAIAGNIGESFAYQVAKKEYDIYVLELSSFQLDGIKKFKPNIAILLNITADHLDRYGNDITNYIKSKFRICKNQTKEDYLVYNNDDLNITEYIHKNAISPKKLCFSTSKTLSKGGFIENNKLTLKSKKTFDILISDLGLQGNHNVKNSMAAGISSVLLNVKDKTLRETLRSFNSIEHRMEKVCTINHVHYINDSKATNINATFYAIESIKTPIIWIAGGIDKGNNYTDLFPLVRNKVKGLICLGKNNIKLKSAFETEILQIIETTQMEKAVYYAHQLAQKGDTVLLSPACASFDLFDSYEDRGNQFKMYINQI